jgi:hypothetical protein
MMMTIALSGCANAQNKPNPLKVLMIDECVTLRRAGDRFNGKKSYPLVRYECEQLLTLDEAYRKIDDKQFRKKRSTTYFDRQENFDAEAWFMITEVVRKKYYPDYLMPEEEVIRANGLAEQQAKTVEDKSVWRQWEPRLLPVSPYLMRYQQLVWADEAASELAHKNKENKDIYTKLRIINRIMLKERQKKDPSHRHFQRFFVEPAKMGYFPRNVGH